MDPFPHSKQDSKARRENLQMSSQTRELCLLPKMMPGQIYMDLGSEESLDNWMELKNTAKYRGRFFTSE